MIKNAAIIGSNGYLGRKIAFFLQTMGIELFCYDIHDQSLLIGCEYHYPDITDSELSLSTGLNLHLKLNQAIPFLMIKRFKKVMKITSYQIFEN